MLIHTVSQIVSQTMSQMVSQMVKDSAKLQELASTSQNCCGLSVKRLV